MKERKPESQKIIIHHNAPYGSKACFKMDNFFTVLKKIGDHFDEKFGDHFDQDSFEKRVYKLGLDEYNDI